MNYRNNMGFIYIGNIDIRCRACRKVIVSSDGTEVNPGRTMQKDEKEESYGLSGPFKFIKRKTAIVCPECQPKLEDEGYYFASWWGTDGMVHGTK